MQYWAVPDSGAIVALSIPAGSTIDFELIARRPGLPAVPGLSIPAAAGRGDAGSDRRRHLCVPPPAHSEQRRRC